MNILAKKKKISLFLILFMYFLSTISVSANTSLHLESIDMAKINYELAKNTTVNFKKISNSEVIYTYSENGKTSFRNMTITAIAIALGAAISGPVGVFMTVAGYLYDKNVKTVYYHVDLYKDLNSSPHRPAFKRVVYFYKDKSHSRAIPGNPVVFIVKP